MEVKTLLRLIKDDIAHLNGITDDFFTESLLLSDEVELALVRARALLRELELLHKFTVQHDNGSKVFRKEEKPDQHEVPEQDNSELESLVYSSEEQDINEQEKKVNPEDETLKPLVESAESAESVDVVPLSNILTEEEVNENIIVLHVSEKSVNNIQNQLIEIDHEANVDIKVAVGQKTAIMETVVLTDIAETKEEILAEEFGEVRKTLNETLGDAHQMVNDILSPEKRESEYPILPINSIWDGIGINDRFRYIRELFSNSPAKFETTIAALDKLDTIHDAVNYLKMNFKWPKTEASQKFLGLIKRRFTK